ncbi:hypothetical protein [Jeotgalibacillus malaysiensis]|uniref:hypothetical protein n=1 Tax=Jeotgalibacillus malaysiensis TaxID=1508404 RepID=UPI00384E34D0
MIKIETLEAVLSISPKRHPKLFGKLQKILDGETFPPVITYELNFEGRSENDDED